MYTVCERIWEFPYVLALRNPVGNSEARAIAQYDTKDPQKSGTPVFWR